MNFTFETKNDTLKNADLDVNDDIMVDVYTLVQQIMTDPKKYEEWVINDVTISKEKCANCKVSDTKRCAKCSLNDAKQCAINALVLYLQRDTYKDMCIFNTDT